MFPRFSQFYKTFIIDVLRIVETSMVPLDFPGNDAFAIKRLHLCIHCIGEEITGLN